MGLAVVPPVSSPTRADHLRSKVVIVDAVKVSRPGLVGSMPGVAEARAE